MKKIVLIILLLILVSPVWSATRYIDWTAGADTNNGEGTGTAWKRAPGMVGCSDSCNSHSVTAGDIFIFKRGETWGAAALPLNVADSGGDGTAITYKSQAGWGTGSYAIFDAENTDSTCVNIVFEVDRIIFDGLHFKDATGQGAYTNGNHDYLTFQNSFFDEADMTNVQGGVENEFIDNIFDGNSNIESSLTIQSGSDALIQGNEIRNFTKYGIKVAYSSGSAVIEFNWVHGFEGGGGNYGIVFRDLSDTIIRYNLVDARGGDRAIHCWSGTAPEEDGNHKVYNNTIITAGASGIVVGNYPTDIYNNIIYSTNGTGIGLQDAGWGSDILTGDNNLLYNLNDDYEGNNFVGFTNDITAQPTFVDTTFDDEDDFKLQSGSEGIEDGTSYDSYSGNDYWGTSVPQNGTVDIGAHEYSNGGDPEPTIYGVKISWLLF